MGIFRQILTEGKDLASVVDGIKKAVMNFKAHTDQQEDLFRKELSKVEDQAAKAMMDIAKVLEKHKGALSEMYADKWSGRVNPKLAECGQAIMGLAEPISTTLAEMSGDKDEVDEASQDCSACDGSGMSGKDECETCDGTGMDQVSLGYGKKGKSESKKGKKK